jgi:alpha-1,6-mannosyltransferase
LTRFPSGQVLGAISAAGYLCAVLLVRSDNTAGDLALFISLFLFLSILWGLILWKSQPSPKCLLGFALLFRAILLPAGLQGYPRLILYDDDVWRYLWEGHVWSAGLNPMRTAPAELEEYELQRRDHALYARLYADQQWGEIYDNVSYREVASPYPFGAQAIFRLAHWLRPGSLLPLKLIVLCFDLGAMALLSRFGNFALLAYAWNPLIVKEFAGSAHIDAALVFFLLAAVAYAGRWGSVWLGLGVLVKPVALLLAPAMLKREGWRALIAPVAAAALIASAPTVGLRAYAAQWTFNPALFRLLPLSRDYALIAAGAALGGLVLYCFRKDDGKPEALITQCIWMFGAFLLLTPMFAPWYATWILPFAAIRRAWFWLALSGSIFLSYHAYLQFTEWLPLVIAEFAIPVVTWLYIRRRAII